MDEFKIVRQQLSLSKFEDRFNRLLNKYPKAERYMNVVYQDRHAWAEYVAPLAFSVGSWTTSRVEGALLPLTVPESVVLGHALFILSVEVVRIMRVSLCTVGMPGAEHGSNTYLAAFFAIPVIEALRRLEYHTVHGLTFAMRVLSAPCTSQ